MSKFLCPPTPQSIQCWLSWCIRFYRATCAWPHTSALNERGVWGGTVQHPNIQQKKISALKGWGLEGGVGTAHSLGFVQHTLLEEIEICDIYFRGGGWIFDSCKKVLFWKKCFRRSYRQILGQRLILTSFKTFVPFPIKQLEVIVDHFSVHESFHVANHLRYIIGLQKSSKVSRWICAFM